MNCCCHCFKLFYWVNKFSSNILSFLPINSWLNLEINQVPGLYINFEQRIQKFLLCDTDYRLTPLCLLTSISSFLNVNAIKRSSFLTSFQFNYTFFILTELKENANQLFLFDKNILKFSFFLSLLKMHPFHLYKNLPTKLIFEDPYRTSLQLKYSRSLTKSSQLLRYNDFLFN